METPPRRARDVAKEAWGLGWTVAEIAHLLGVSERTMYRRLHEWGLLPERSTLAGRRQEKVAEPANPAATLPPRTDTLPPHSSANPLPQVESGQRFTLTHRPSGRKLVGDEMSTAIIQDDRRRGRPRKGERALEDDTWDVLDEKANEYGFITGRPTTKEELAELAITLGLPLVMQQAGEKHGEEAKARLERLLGRSADKEAEDEK